VIILDDQVHLPEGAMVKVQIDLTTKDESPTDELPTLADTMKDFIGVLEDLPEDAATNHDHYLYGTQRNHDGDSRGHLLLRRVTQSPG
jgi:hypothetical protein